MEECRLIYKSISTEEITSNQTLADIIDKATAVNTKLNITGLLILSGDQFLQVLEGPIDAVNDLYLKIAKDDRHKKVTLIDYEIMSTRYFKTWSMQLVDLWDLPGETRNFLLKKYDSVDKVIQIPNTLDLIYSLLVDAKSFCDSKPWEKKR